MSLVDTTTRSLQRFDIDDAFDDVMAAIDGDGSAIVERFVPPDLLARLNAELDARIETKAPGAEDVSERMAWFWGRQTKRFTRIAAFAPSFAELLDHDFMHRWAQRELDGDY